MVIALVLKKINDIIKGGPKCNFFKRILGGGGEGVGPWSKTTLLLHKSTGLVSMLTYEKYLTHINISTGPMLRHVGLAKTYYLTVDISFCTC